MTGLFCVVHSREVPLHIVNKHALGLCQRHTCVHTHMLQLWSQAIQLYAAKQYRRIRNCLLPFCFSRPASCALSWASVSCLLQLTACGAAVSRPTPTPAWPPGACPAHTPLACDGCSCCCEAAGSVTVCPQAAVLTAAGAMSSRGALLPVVLAKAAGPSLW